MARESQRVWLTFGAETIGQPLICEMAQQFEIVFNIKNASVTPTIGIIALELSGERNEIQKAVAWLENRGVQVEPVELNTIEG